AIEDLCCDQAFNVSGLQRIAELNAQWGGRNGAERAETCERWLAASHVERARTLEELHGVWARKDGEIRSFANGQAPGDKDYAALAAAAFEYCARLLAMRRTEKLVAAMSAGLRAGQTFARAYAGAKRGAGLVDFDDLIRSAESLL